MAVDALVHPAFTLTFLGLGVGLVIFRRDGSEHHIGEALPTASPTVPVTTAQINPTISPSFHQTLQVNVSPHLPSPALPQLVVTTCRTVPAYIGPVDPRAPKAHFVEVGFLNERERGGAHRQTAKGVVAHITFFTEHGALLFGPMPYARWAHVPEPHHERYLDERSRTDIPADGMPKWLNVALRMVTDEDAFGFSNESIVAGDVWRMPSYRLGPGTYRVQAKLLGENVEKEFWFTLTIPPEVGSPPVTTTAEFPAPVPPNRPTLGDDSPTLEWLEWNEPNAADDRIEYRSWISAVLRFRSVRDERVQAFIDFDNNRQLDAVISRHGSFAHEYSALAPDKQYAVWVFLDLPKPVELWVDKMTPPHGTLGPQTVPAVQPGCYWTDAPFMQRLYRQRLGPGTYKARVRLVFGDKRTRTEHTTDWREFVVPEPPPAPASPGSDELSPSPLHKPISPAPPPHLSRLDFADAAAQAVLFGGSPPVLNVAEVSLAWRDTGSALHVEVSNANGTGDAVRGFTLSVADIRWYDPKTNQSQEAQEVHGNGPFQELQLLGGTTQIFANRPEVFPFLDADCNYQGRTMDSPLEQKRLVTRGIWEVTFAVNRRSVIKAGRKLWFEWREGQPPKPWLPPSHRVKAVTAAPEPPRFLGSGKPPRWSGKDDPNA